MKSLSTISKAVLTLSFTLILAFQAEAGKTPQAKNRLKVSNFVTLKDTLSEPTKTETTALSQQPTKNKKNLKKDNDCMAFWLLSDCLSF